MPVIRITHVYDNFGEECENTYHFFNASKLPDPADVDAVINQWKSLVMPSVNALQVTGVNNVEVRGYAYNLGYSLTSGALGGGTIAGTLADVVANDMGLVVRRIPGLTFLNDGGAAYTGNRPIRRSHMLLGGIPKAVMDGHGFEVSGYTGTRWADFGASMLLIMPGVGGGTGAWYHNVFGLPLPATASTPSFPGGKPARPAVVAPVTGVTAQEFGDLKTRG